MILLINPKTSKPSEVNSNFFREPNSGLLYLAAILELNDIPCEILDLEQYRGLTDIEFSDVVQERIKDYNIFGITSLTNTFHIALDIARIIKKRNKNNIVIMGGPHVSFLYKEILEHDKSKENLIDFICIGEAENSFLKLIKILISSGLSPKMIITLANQIKNINGIAFNDSNGELSVNLPHGEINVEELPLPARYKLPQDNYYYSVANVIVNRGCSNQCSFCSRQKMFKTTRIRSIDSVLAEIRDIISLQTYNHINFYDNININKKYFRTFCEMFIENDINIPWGCEIRVDTVTLEESQLLKKAGCRLIATGIESANSNVLNKNFKYQDPERVRVGIFNLKEQKIPIQAYFVLGLPGETEQSVYQTIEYLKSLPLDDNDEINYFVATPYPGSRLWDDKEKFDINIIENDFNKYDCEHIIFETRELNKEKLIQLYTIAKKVEKEFK